MFLQRMEEYKVIQQVLLVLRGLKRVVPWRREETSIGFQPPCPSGTCLRYLEMG